MATVSENSSDVIQPAADGYYYPESAQDIQNLVKLASSRNGKIRVVGSAHSVSNGIYAGPESANPKLENKPVAPGNPETDFNLKLAKMKAVGKPTPIEGSDDALVVVQAGCHLGREPFTPGSTWQNSFCWILQEAGYAIPNMGGLSQQTVSGFGLNGCNGGGFGESYNQALEAFTIIDGNANILKLSKHDENPDDFYAAGVSMGLFGILVDMTFRVIPSYDLNVSNQAVPAAKNAVVDFFYDQPASAKLPTFGEFMKSKDYSRIEYWPLKGLEQLEVWQAAKIGPKEPEDGEFPAAQHEQNVNQQESGFLLSMTINTLIGNIDTIKKFPKWANDIHSFHWCVAQYFNQITDPVSGQKIPKNPLLTPIQRTTEKILPDPDWVDYDYNSPPDKVADMVERYLAEQFVGIQAEIAQKVKEDPSLAPALKAQLAFMTGLRDALVLTYKKNDWETQAAQDRFTAPAGKSLADTAKELAGSLYNFFSSPLQKFREPWRMALPQDDMIMQRTGLVIVDFAELWVPFEAVEYVAKKLKEYFDPNHPDNWERCGRGFQMVEMYPTPASKFWMSPAYGHDVLKIDCAYQQPYDLPMREAFMQGIWDLFTEMPNGWSFRPHWAKLLPKSSPFWQDYYKKHFPKMEDWLAKRAKFDPKGIFCTKYWQDNLGITLA